ncbi:MAG: cbb3-type cytochrome c oxidase subunit I [Planctomycetes bacterium]|nr:cbb3-type cytochrome c oxidase subunit I [Planctomycetota bacterium]
MNRKHWWKYMLVLVSIGAAGVLFMGARTYADAPPVPHFVDAQGNKVIDRETVLDGQQVFQKYALMNYGSMFGDGGARGPDYTAEALHQVAVSMNAWYTRRAATDAALQAELIPEGIEPRVQRELRENRHDAKTNSVPLNEAQLAAWKELESYYAGRFSGTTPGDFHPSGYITDQAELHALAAFFFWGQWVCAVERPGTGASYTHNWPYDELAGNTPTSGTLLWSVMGSLALIAAVGGVLYFHGRFAGTQGWQANGCLPVATQQSIAQAPVTDIQRSTYKFFAAAMGLFFLQIVAGIFTIHDFVGFTTFFGIDFSRLLPVTVTRSWHVQLSVLWIATCWIAGSLFLLPRISPAQPQGQRRLINILFWSLVVVASGMLLGTALGPRDLLGGAWRMLGNQGWEFVELGKFFQWLLAGCLVLWAVIVYRGVRPVLRIASPFALPNWMLYAVMTITLLFGSGFIAGARENFVISDFWRWCVIHMWAECFFEVFTTMIIAYYMVMMGLVSRESATRVVFFATLLFLGSGLLGISHNFYWNAKPEPMLAIGAVFSTMQVVPLVLLTLEAWRFKQMPLAALRASLGRNARLEQFGLPEAFLFLMAVNFWNFLGAGVFGFIINLPIVNYYEHGTYLTVNHGHAALMGVYGNLSVAAVMFCARHVVKAEHWNTALVRIAFWSLNLGLMLMVLLDTLPAGIAQLSATLEHGLWQARSHEFIESSTFQTLTWMRAVGGVMFFVGGVTPLAWFIISRLRNLKDATPAQAFEQPLLAPETGEHEALEPAEAASAN